jgi:hypothetical protein
VVVLDEQPGGIGDLGDAVGGEVEAADLVDRAEPVLDRAQHPEPGVAVALEVEHHVDEVLEHPGPGDRALLGDVADDDRGDVAGLGDPDQRGGDLLDLGDAAGHTLDTRGADRLDRVDDQQCGPGLLDVGEHGAEVGLGREVELVVDAAGAVGAQPHLARRLLAGDVERPVLEPRGLGGHLEQQGALADARLAREQYGGARHESATEHPVELGDPAAARTGLLDGDLADRDGSRRDRGGRRTHGGGGCLRDRAPCLALAATADPLAGLPPALAAAVAGPWCLRHEAHARRPHRQHPCATP